MDKIVVNIAPGEKNLECFPDFVQFLGMQFPVDLGNLQVSDMRILYFDVLNTYT